MAKPDIAQIVFEQIEKNLDNPGVWDNGRVNTFKPYNPVSNKPYRGINILNLGLASMANNWEFPHFMTFKQAKGLGASVKKGEKSNSVVFWKFISFQDKKDPDKTVNTPLLKQYRVFNIAQIEGLPKKYTELETGEAEKLVVPEELVTKYLDREGLDIVKTFSSPYYSPVKDVIGMPPLEDFKTSTRYYENLFHEMIHSTGHTSRLNRLDSTGGAGEYSREELVAEFGAAFLLGETGADEGFRNLAAYLKAWWKRIGENPKDLVVAAGRAQKASEYVKEGKALIQREAA